MASVQGCNSINFGKVHPRSYFFSCTAAITLFCVLFLHSVFLFSPQSHSFKCHIHRIGMLLLAFTLLLHFISAETAFQFRDDDYIQYRTVSAIPFEDCVANLDFQNSKADLVAVTKSSHNQMEHHLVRSIGCGTGLLVHGSLLATRWRS